MRRRLPESGPNEDRGEEEESSTEEKPFLFTMPRSREAMPAASELLALKPSKSGYCDKKNTSLLVKICSCCFKAWKKRFFILVGNFLYRFADETGETPKGVPVPLDSCTVRVLAPIENEGFFCFEVSTIRKNYIIRASSQQEAEEWVQAIKTRKLMAIKEGLGHAPVEAGVREANKKAGAMFSKRIDLDRLEGEEMRKQMNRSTFNPMMGNGTSM